MVEPHDTAWEGQMTETPGSGNRWEPGPGDTAPVSPTPAAPGPAPAAPLAPPVPATAAPAAAAGRRGWRDRVSGARAALVAGLVALLLAFGAGGFALGRT